MPTLSLGLTSLDKMQANLRSMEKATSCSLPVIDLRDFPAELENLRRACEEWGCFRVVGHGVPPSLMAEMKKAVRSLFDVPAETKQRNSEAIPGSGYVAPSKANPHYESLGLYDTASPRAVQEFCDLLGAPPPQREVIGKYAEAVHGLAMEICRRLAESLGVSPSLFEGWPCQFRLNKYHYTSETVGSLGVQIHTDSGFLTVLQEDEMVGGLEVMNKHGDFVGVDPSPGTFIVNFGDIATAWSNGRFVNVRHRVRCVAAATRFSIATFLLGPKDAVVEAPPQLVDESHPRLYFPFNQEDLRKLRLSKNMRAGEALHLLRASS